MGLAARASITSLNNANAVPTLLEMKRAAPSRADTIESRLLRLIREQTLVAIRDAAAAMEMAILDARQILASLEQQGIVIELRSHGGAGRGTALDVFQLTPYGRRHVDAL